MKIRGDGYGTVQAESTEENYEKNLSIDRYGRPGRRRVQHKQRYYNNESRSRHGTQCAAQRNAYQPGDSFTKRCASSLK
jgi:hypothetical protein